MRLRLREHRGLQTQEELFSKLKGPGNPPGQALIVHVHSLKLSEGQLFVRSQASSPTFKWTFFGRHPSLDRALTEALGQAGMLGSPEVLGWRIGKSPMGCQDCAYRREALWGGGHRGAE